MGHLVLQGVWGLGGGFEGDLVAKGLEFADVVMHFAVEVNAGVVVVGPEVAELGVVIAEQVPGNDEDRAADRDDGSFLAAPSGEAPVTLTQERVGLARADGGLAQDPGQVAVTVSGGAGALLAACGLLDAGANRAQDERWAGVGKRVMSRPTSAMITAAAVAPTPGISSRRATASAKGAR